MSGAADYYSGLRGCVDPENGRGPYLEMGSGRLWYVLDPRPEDVHINDIAAALSKVCRYGGHCKKFYSVAQHCILGADYALKSGLTPKQALHVLLHDASEAYLVDMPAPIKRVMPQYREIEERAERAIAERFGLEFPWPAYVKVVDRRMLNTEQRDLMPAGPPYAQNVEPYPDVIAPWTPELAEKTYRTLFRIIGEGVVLSPDS